MQKMSCNMQKSLFFAYLGGRAYWSYGLEVAKDTAEQTGAALIVIPGDDRPDLDLMGHSTVSLVGRRTNCGGTLPKGALKTYVTDCYTSAIAFSQPNTTQPNPKKFP